MNEVELSALTQRFRELHAQVMACFDRLHAADTPQEKLEAATQLHALLAQESQLVEEAAQFAQNLQA